MSRAPLSSGRTYPAPPPLPVQDDGQMRGAVVLLAGAFLAGMALLSLYNIRMLPMMMALGFAACAGVAAIRFTVATSAAWLIVAGTSPEMWLGDILGGYQSEITAAVKAVGLCLVVVCMIRYGARRDLVNPGIAFVVMFLVSLGHGMHPQLTMSESLRSLIGSIAPFAFSFSRLSRNWCRAIIWATKWVSLVIVVFGFMLAIPGLRPAFADYGDAVRLAGSSHPAFLGGFALAGIYAALVELYRDGRNSNIVAIGVNFVILVLSGARAPLAYGVLVCAIAFFTLRSARFTARKKVLPMLLAGLLLPVLVVVIASGSSSLRLFETLDTNATGLSGRDALWPYFEDAWASSPTFGWGVGAAKEVIDPDSVFAKIIGTTAAHNEYLRIGVEGGYFGLILLWSLMAAWFWWHTRRARTTDCVILRLVLVAFALHSITDNTLIAATASVLFAWVSAVFARAELEAEEDAWERQEAPLAESPSAPSGRRRGVA